MTFDTRRYVEMPASTTSRGYERVPTRGRRPRDLIVTVNTAPGHFDRKQYQAVNVARPTEFLNVPEVGRFVKKLIRG